MTKNDLIDLEKILMEEVVKRRKLGGFDTNAGTILTLAESCLAIVQHLKAQSPRKK